MNTAQRQLNIWPLMLVGAAILILSGFFYAMQHAPTLSTAVSLEDIQITTRTQKVEVSSMSDSLSLFNPKGDDLSIRIGPKGKPKLALTLSADFHAGKCTYKAVFSFLSHKAERNQQGTGNCDKFVVWDLFNQVWQEVLSKVGETDKSLWKYILEDVVLNAVRLWIAP